MLERFMQLHGPKRVYTRDSLEFWFSKLEREWDAKFPSEHLAAGRRLYRSGGIREIELTDRDAIVHCRIDKKDEYSVLEWEDGVLDVRSSSADPGLANTIAVAGLHEIEELVADEIPILPSEQPPEDPGKATSCERLSPQDGVDDGKRTRRAAAASNNGNGPTAESTTPARTARPKRDLILRFRVESGGLVCEPWWQEWAGSRARALDATGKSNGTSTPNAKELEMPGGDGNGNPAPNAAERMKLISLTALARKSHFRFQSDSGAYVLEQTEEIPHFLKNVLPTWKRSFAIESTADVERLAKGVQAVRVEARAGIRSSGGELNLEWIFRAGEQLLSAEASQQLTAAGGAPVVIPDVGMVALAPQSLESLRQWDDVTDELEDGTLPAYLLFSLFNDHRCGLELSTDLEAWRESVVSPDRRRSLKLPEFLRPYQRRGVEWMAHMADHGCHCLLADEMGLGKTVQVAALLTARPIKGKNHLVVCPASVVPVWQEEMQRFFPQQRLFVLKNGHDFRHERAKGVWLASYAQLRNHRSLLDACDFGYAVLDEGQFIKNPDAKVTTTCFAIRARHRLVLTGTPLENRQLDLWSILRFLLPGLLGTRAAFEAALQADREKTMEKLRQQVAPFILRRTKAQVATELPPKAEMELLCPLTDTQRIEYARVCREGLDRLGDDIGQAMREKAFGFLSLLTRLRQICCDPDLLPWMHAEVAASGKLTLLVERLGEIISSGHKVVIFSQFVMFLKRVHEALDQHFPDVPRFELTGATVDRQKPVQDFQNTEEASFMLVSLKAAGTGITLHAADYVFLLDPWWNPAVEEQAVDRVHRIGQTRTVFVYRMATQGTIEERIQALKEEKRQLFQQIIDGVSGDLDLSQHFRSLRQLIELPPESGEEASDEVL